MFMAWEQNGRGDSNGSVWKSRDAGRIDAVKAMLMINVPVQVWLAIQPVGDLTRCKSRLSPICVCGSQKKKLSGRETSLCPTYIGSESSQKHLTEETPGQSLLRNRGDSNK